MPLFRLLFPAFRVINNTTKNAAHEDSTERRHFYADKNLKVALHQPLQQQPELHSRSKIQMEGKWLEELGFAIGTLLKVEFEEGSIRIRPLTEEEASARKQQELKAELDRKSAELKQVQLGLAAAYAGLSPNFPKLQNPIPRILLPAGSPKSSK